MSLCHFSKTRLKIQIHCFTNVFIQWLYRFSQSFLDSRVRNKARRLSLTGYFLWVTTHQLCLSLTRSLLPSLCRQPWCSMASPQGSAANSHVDRCQWQLVNLSSPFCHFRAPALTFRQFCPCPPKLAAPDGGGQCPLDMKASRYKICPNSQLSWRQRNQDHPLLRYHACEEFSPTYRPEAWEVSALL